MMQWNWKSRLVVSDWETTGINSVSDRIVETATLTVPANGKEQLRSYRINPEMPIPKQASEIHGIYDEDVKDAPTFKQIARDLAKFLEGCDLGGFNSNKFDIPLLAEEFIRVDVDFDMQKRRFVDVQTIFHKMEKRTLEAAYKFYCQKDLKDAHSAEADTVATYEVLKAQLDRYPELENDVSFLAKFSSHNRTVDFAGRIVYNDNDVEVFNFGKYKGVSVEEVLEKDPGYYGWMMNGDFPLYTKKVLTNIKLRRLKG